MCAVIAALRMANSYQIEALVEGASVLIWTLTQRDAVICKVVVRCSVQKLSSISSQLLHHDASYNVDRQRA